MLDFQNSDPNARDSETLMLFATMLKQDGQNLQGFLPAILNALCSSTLNMISNDFLSYPEFREGFFVLIRNIISYCTQGLIQLDPANFSTIIDTVIFGAKHEKPEVMEVSL